MIPMTLSEIASYAGSELCYGKGDQPVSCIVTDSRKIVPGCLFVAIRGEKFDGHNFVSQAVEQGAVAAVVLASFENAMRYPVIPVEDTLLALGRIGSGYLKHHFTGLRKIAVTGSVGKTSTKDMIAHVLGGTYRTCKTPMNFNNEIGLPMTLLSLEEEHQALVAEMGMRGFGQIRYLTELVEPHISVITNIGTSHLELLGSRENILRAKMECCFAGIASKINKPYRLIVNGDNDLLQDTKQLKKMAKEYGCTHVVVVSFGFGPKCAYRATDIRMEGTGMRFTLWCDRGHFSVYLPVLGEHNVYNALAAVAVADACGISVENAIARLSAWGTEVSRQKIVSYEGVTVIDDTYNASPESMRASLSVLQQLSADVKVAVLGDMLELGVASVQGHIEIGRMAGTICRHLIAVGDLAEGYCQGFSLAGCEGTVERFGVSEDAVSSVVEICKKATAQGQEVALLVKGSHSMHMERVTEGIAEQLNS